MRLLIESRKLTIELASTKHLAADHPGTDTLVSVTKQEGSCINRSDTQLSQSPTDDKSSSETPDTSVYRSTQLPRRKSIHKRIGGIFLRISKMCSDAQCSIYAHQYGRGVSELPAGESPIEGTTSFYEMPGSSPRAELESQDMEKLLVHSYPPRMPYAQAAPEHLRNYYKANQNATLRRAAPVSVANLSQLPRLEVPQSQNCVPKLISDHSPLTPSPISPITPVRDAEYGYRDPSSSLLYLDTISPCAAPKQGQIFAHYGSWEQHAQVSPATPSTTDSYGLSYTTTPLSAYPPSANSSFQSWPQLQTGQQPPQYSQAFAPVQHSQSTINATLTGANSWHMDNLNNVFPVFQMQSYQSNIPEVLQPHGPFSQAQSCFEKQNQMATASTHTRPQTSYTLDEAPPAYSPVVPDPQPVTTNPQHHYPPAVCQQCGKVFRGKYGPGNCKRHVQQTHASIFDRAIHMCKICTKTYNRADALRKHQWKKHRLEDARPNKRRDRKL